MASDNAEMVQPKKHQRITVGHIHVCTLSEREDGKVEVAFVDTDPLPRDKLRRLLLRSLRLKNKRPAIQFCLVDALLRQMEMEDVAVGTKRRREEEPTQEELEMLRVVEAEEAVAKRTKRSRVRRHLRIPSQLRGTIDHLDARRMALMKRRDDLDEKYRKLETECDALMRDRRLAVEKLIQDQEKDKDSLFVFRRGPEGVRELASAPDQLGRLLLRVAVYN